VNILKKEISVLGHSLCCGRASNGFLRLRCCHYVSTTLSHGKHLLRV